MIFVLEFLFYFIFLIFKLYSLLDSYLLFSYQGSKIDRYIKQRNLTNITSSLDCTKNVFLKSPISYRYCVYSILVAMEILAIKVAVTYNFFSSSFFVVKFFSKNIDLISYFGFYFTVFKYLYYTSAFIFYANTIYFLLIRYFKNNNLQVENNENNGYLLGLDKDNNNIYIKDYGMYQNILITGSIGSGKTSSCISNMVDYLISNKMSGLIIDVKGNYINTVRKICKKNNCENKICEISLESDFKYNPMDSNIKAFELAHNLRRVLEVLSETNNSDSYWLDKSEGYIKDFIILMRVYAKYASFFELHKLVTTKEYLSEKIEQVLSKCLENRFSDEELFEINSSINNLKKEYLSLDDRTFNIIRSEITRITNIFAGDYILYNKFCCKSDKMDFKSDNIYVLSFNIAKNRKLSKIISAYIKLDFQNQVLSFNDKPVFFICDEYQEIANIEDAHFLSLSREFKCINIVSIQSYMSLINSLKNKDASSVIIQNLVNKIWLRNDDMYTVNEIIKQIGKEDKDKVSISINEGSKETTFRPFTKKFKNLKSNLTEGYSISKTNENILDTSYFTTYLKTFESVCIISDGTSSKLYKKVKMKMLDV